MLAAPRSRALSPSHGYAGDGTTRPGSAARGAVEHEELGVDTAPFTHLLILFHIEVQRIKRVYVPVEDTPEAALIGGVEILPVTTLRQLVMHLNGHPLAPSRAQPYQRWAGARTQYSPTTGVN